MLNARQLSCARATRPVLTEVSLSLRAGEVLGVLGANGSGKTSLLATLAGELPTASGELQLDGQPLSAWSARALARRRAVLPQSPALAFDLEVSAVVAMGGYPFPELAPSALAALTAWALRMADAQHLTGRRHGSLSGGEQQRVQFARVVVQLLAARTSGEYRMLLLDEPTASLDPRHQATLLQAVAMLAHQHGIAAVVVLHDVNLAAAWCDRVLLLGAGRPVGLDTPQRVLTPANLQVVYGLGARVMDHPDRNHQPLVLFELPGQPAATAVPPG